MKNCLLLIMVLCLGGCYTSEIITKDPSKIEIKEVKKINLKDGTTVDFSDKYYQNLLITLKPDEFTYKDPAGNLYKISKEKVAGIYEKSLDTWKSFLFIIGAGVAITLILITRLFHN